MEFRDMHGDIIDVTDGFGGELLIGIDNSIGVFDDRAEVARLHAAFGRWLETGSVEEMDREH